MWWAASSDVLLSSSARLSVPDFLFAITRTFNERSDEGRAREDTLVRTVLCIYIALCWRAVIGGITILLTLGISIAEFAIARTIRSLDCALQGMVGSAHPTTYHPLDPLE